MIASSANFVTGTERTQVRMISGFTGSKQRKDVETTDGDRGPDRDTGELPGLRQGDVLDRSGLDRITGSGKMFVEGKANLARAEEVQLNIRRR